MFASGEGKAGRLLLVCFFACLYPIQNECSNHLKPLGTSRLR